MALRLSCPEASSLRPFPSLQSSGPSSPPSSLLSCGLFQLLDRVRPLGLVTVVATLRADMLVNHLLTRHEAAAVDYLLVGEVWRVFGQLIERHELRPVRAQVDLAGKHFPHVLL